MRFLRSKLTRIRRANVRVTVLRGRRSDTKAQPHTLVIAARHLRQTRHRLRTSVMRSRQVFDTDLRSRKRRTASVIAPAMLLTVLVLSEQYGGCFAQLW